MEWWVSLTLIFGGVFLLLLIRVPVAFAFFAATIFGIYYFQGGGRAFHQYVLSIYASISSFTLLPVPLFVLMGEILWHSRIAERALGALDKLLGNIPGRLSLLTVMSGTIFSSLSGSSMANTALLGRMMLPRMRRLGYSGDMSIGTILCCGALAMIIPPSALAVIFATIARISVADLLLGLIAPGLMLAAIYTLYIVVRAALRPSVAPSEAVGVIPLSEKIADIVKYVAPLSIVIVSVIGVIFLGVATPTEAAALGCVASLGLALAYRGLSWNGMLAALKGTVFVSVMMLSIIAAAIGFSQILAFSGATRGLIQFATSLEVSPIVLVLIMLVVVLILGCFIEQLAIMMITIPIFFPIIVAAGIDPIWFAVVMLISLEIALMTPPFGLLLFVMKGIAPKDVSMTEVYVAAMPFLVINLFAIGLIVLIPDIATFIPAMTR